MPQDESYIVDSSFPNYFAFVEFYTRYWQSASDFDSYDAAGISASEGPSVATTMLQGIQMPHFIRSQPSLLFSIISCTP